MADTKFREKKYLENNSKKYFLNKVQSTETVSDNTPPNYMWYRTTKKKNLK